MPTVLIVEDEPLVREIAEIEFTDAGYDVIAVENGTAALAVLAARSIDLLFTDIRLPGGIDGWQVARQARAGLPGLPVIYASGYPGDVVDVVPGGRFVRKPYRPRDILAIAQTISGAAEGPA